MLLCWKGMGDPPNFLGQQQEGGSEGLLDVKQCMKGLQDCCGANNCWEVECCRRLQEWVLARRRGSL